MNERQHRFWADHGACRHHTDYLGRFVVAPAAQEANLIRRRYPV
jgi:hypothetical protein